MPKKTRPKKRDRRMFTDEQKRAIIAEITPKRTVAAVARKHDIMPSLLRQWRQKLGSNGHAPAPFVLADHLPEARPAEVQASLDQALADIERAGRSIAAIREAARKVFGV
jgi:transposase-like protein